MTYCRPMIHTRFPSTGLQQRFEDWVLSRRSNERYIALLPGHLNNALFSLAFPPSRKCLSFCPFSTNFTRNPQTPNPKPQTPNPSLLSAFSLKAVLWRLNSGSGSGEDGVDVCRDMTP